jgi:hypothetical protein
LLIEARADGLGRARTSRAAGAGSLYVEVIVPEGAVGCLAVDVRAIVPNCPDRFTIIRKRITQIVLQNRDLAKILGGGNLQGDAAACGLVFFTPIRSRRDRSARGWVAVPVGRPDIDFEVAVVVNVGVLGADSSDGSSECRDGGNELHCCSCWVEQRESGVDMSVEVLKRVLEWCKPEQ